MDKDNASVIIRSSLLCLTQSTACPIAREFLCIPGEEKNISSSLIVKISEHCCIVSTYQLITSWRCLCDSRAITALISITCMYSSKSDAPTIPILSSSLRRHHILSGRHPCIKSVFILEDPQAELSKCSISVISSEYGAIVWVETGIEVFYIWETRRQHS